MVPEVSPELCTFSTSVKVEEFIKFIQVYSPGRHFQQYGYVQCASLIIQGISNWWQNTRPSQHHDQRTYSHFSVLNALLCFLPLLIQGSKPQSINRCRRLLCLFQKLVSAAGELYGIRKALHICPCTTLLLDAEPIFLIYDQI